MFGLKWGGQANPPPKSCSIRFVPRLLVNVLLDTQDRRAKSVLLDGNKTHLQNGTLFPVSYLLHRAKTDRRQKAKSSYPPTHSRCVEENPTLQQEANFAAKYGTILQCLWNQCGGYQPPVVCPVATFAERLERELKCPFALFKQHNGFAVFGYSCDSHVLTAYHYIFMNSRVIQSLF